MIYWILLAQWHKPWFPIDLPKKTQQSSHFLLKHITSLTKISHPKDGQDHGGTTHRALPLCARRFAPRHLRGTKCLGVERWAVRRAGWGGTHDWEPFISLYHLQKWRWLGDDELLFYPHDHTIITIYNN